MNSEKQIRLLNQKLKNSNTNNNKLISQENHNLNIKLVDMEKENQFYKNKLEEMVKQINNIKKSDNGNNNSQEVINMVNKTKNLEFKINQLNQEIFQLKKEKDILELTNNNLLSEIEKINQNKTSQNQNTNDIDISSTIKKKEKVIDKEKYIKLRYHGKEKRVKFEEFMYVKNLDKQKLQATKDSMIQMMKRKIEFHKNQNEVYNMNILNKIAVEREDELRNTVYNLQNEIRKKRRRCK